MAGKESGGAALADAELFRGAAWLFTSAETHPLANEWRATVTAFGAHIREIDPARSDQRRRPSGDGSTG